jgi:hypothetical protein
MSKIFSAIVGQDLHQLRNKLETSSKVQQLRRISAPCSETRSFITPTISSGNYECPRKKGIKI